MPKANQEELVPGGVIRNSQLGVSQPSFAIRLPPTSQTLSPCSKPVCWGGEAWEGREKRDSGQRSSIACEDTGGMRTLVSWGGVGGAIRAPVT